MLNKRQSDISSGSETASTPASTPESSAQPTTSATPTTPVSTPASTASPSQPSSSEVSTPVSTPPTTSDAPSSTLSSAQPSSTATPTTSDSTSSPSPSTSSVVQSISSISSTSTTSAASTFQSTVFLQTTNSLGQVTSFAPLQITSTFTSTLSNGGVATFTEVIANPTLSANDRASNSTQFFNNKGAVAGVFLIVGLAAATICLWIFFFLRRRRRRRRIDHDSAVSASLADAGYNRAPIDDEDFGPAPGMRQRFGSLSSHPSLTTPITDDERALESTVPSVSLYDPYAEYGRPVAGSGYIPARSSSPSQHSRDRAAEGTYTTGVSRRSGSAHVPDHGSGSIDPLLPQTIPHPYTLSFPTVPPRNPNRKGSQDIAGPSTVRYTDSPPPPLYGSGGGGDQN